MRLPRSLLALLAGLLLLCAGLARAEAPRVVGGQPSRDVDSGPRGLEAGDERRLPSRILAETGDAAGQIRRHHGRDVAAIRVETTGREQP